MRTALIIACLAFAGCGTLLDGPPSNRCASDAECGMGTCNVPLGMCVAQTEETVSIGFEVRPMTEPYGGSVQPIAFEPFSVDGPLERDITLTPGVVVNGIVRDTAGTPVSAELAFTRESLIPGAPSTTIVADSSDMDPPQIEAGMPVGFVTQLLPDRRNDVVVTPTGEWAARLPPLSLAYASPSEGGGRIQLDYPPMCDDPAVDSECLATFEGRVIDREGTGQAGVVVKLVDRESGRTLSSRYVTATDPELDPGFFRLFFPVAFWQDTDAWFLRVSPAPHRVAEVGPSPTFTRTAEALAEVDGMITVLAPNLEDLRLTYAGTVETDDARPLPGATIRFTSEDVTHPDTNITGSYTTTVQTDEDGAFSVELLGHPDAPATYDIVVTPNQVEDQLGVLREERRLGVGSAGQLFTVPTRARFGGTVLTVAGERMVDARVDAQSRGSDRDGMLDAVAFLARSSQTLTDSDGLFDLRLDVGVYDVVIAPPEGTNFPWHIERDVAIGGAEAPLTSVYDLNHPVPITGVATWNVGDTPVPMAEGEIRAYAVIESDAGTRAILVGRATTDANGAYTLLLPPSL